MIENAKLKWDQDGQRFYESGVERGVLYKVNTTATGEGVNGKYAGGVPWNGLTAVNENPSGADATPLYANNKKYLDLRASEEYGATIEAYTYPDEWEECDGSAEIIAGSGIYAGQQARVTFGLSYVTLINNDQEADKYGYKIHLIYSATASPSQKSHGTTNESPDAPTMSWEISATKTDAVASGLKPTATLVIPSVPKDGKGSANATKYAAFITKLEEALYGTSGESGTEAYLPTPNEVAAMYTAAMA